jgi:hypothetical protein
MAKPKGADDFQKLYDNSYVVPKKIQEGLAKLGPDGWEYQAEFAKSCGVNNLAHFNAYCVQFEKDHCVQIGGSKGKRAWAGSKALATKMRSML